MRHRTLTVLLLLCVPACAAMPRVVASGETHAMLHGCDCPDNPGGGMAERAALLDSLRRCGPLLLLDAGGFAGGGIYDIYTEGRQRDSLRTIAMVAAMAAMRYDAAVPGDDDLQYGAQWLAALAGRSGLPLVCANCRTASGTSAFEPYRVVTVNGLRIGVTGLTTAERLFGADDSLLVADAVGALKSIWAELRAKSDVQVVLAHLGEEASLALADSFPQAAIVVNGHRKRTPYPLMQAGNTVLMQFGFQGKELSQLSPDSSPGWLDVRPGLAPDTAVARLLEPGPGRARQPYDLYLMSQCPYGLPALGEFAAFVRRFGDIEWNVWFIGTVEDDGRLNSLHGEAETADEKLWLAVKALHPDRWFEFLSVRSAASGPTDSLAAQMGLDTEAMRRWAGEHGGRELAMHYRRSMRINVNASPTLMRANQPLEVEISALRLAKGACDHGDVVDTACRALPICIDDGDCRQPGKLGACVKRQGGAVCRFRDDVRFRFVVVVRDTTEPDRSVDASLATTSDLFPGAAIKRVALASRRGQRLVRELRPAALPLYLFQSKVSRAARYAEVAGGLEPLGRYLTFKPGVMPRTFFLRRPVGGGVRVYVDPLLPALEEVLQVVAARRGAAIRPLLLADPAAPAADSLAAARLEAARRWIPHDSLASAWADEQELEVASPVALLVNNQRLVRVRDVAELERELERVAPAVR